jgi:hypothetical protein
MIMPSMRVPMMMMSTRSVHPNEVDSQSDGTDNEELTRVHLWRVEQSLDRFEDDEDGDEAQEQSVGKSRESLNARVSAFNPRQCLLAGRTSVETHPYVNLSFGCHVAMTLAKRPMPSARQSKNMWIATIPSRQLSTPRSQPRYSQSEMRPRLFVKIPYTI